MSLASLNSPLLVLSAGVGAGAVLPALEKAIENGSISWSVVRVANAVAFGLNVVATSRPGRIDSEGFDDKDSSSESSKELAKMSPGGRGKTLVAPAGWAFAIWGPIFLGELVFTAAQFGLPETSALVPIIREASGPFLVAQTYQCLWAAAFRPKYKGTNRYISAVMLSGIAGSLARAHAAYTTTTSSDYSQGEYLMYFLPMSLHFGWTTAAALVNWNGALVVQEYATPRLAAWMGHLSIVVATGAGVAITLSRNAPVFGGVIAWALSACASGMKTRIKETKNTDNHQQQTIGVYGALTQYRLCVAGAVASAAASLVVVFAKPTDRV